PALGAEGRLAVPGQRVGDDSLVVELADDLAGVVPDLQAAGRLGVLDRVGRHLADREHQVNGRGLGQPGLAGVALHDGPDRAQVGGVWIRHRITVVWVTVVWVTVVWVTVVR